MKFLLLINIKMQTIVGILIFISMKIFMLSSAVQEQEESLNLFFIGRTNFILSWVEHDKKFYDLGACSFCLTIWKLFEWERRLNIFF